MMLKSSKTKSQPPILEKIQEFFEDHPAFLIGLALLIFVFLICCFLFWRSGAKPVTEAKNVVVQAVEKTEGPAPDLPVARPQKADLTPVSDGARDFADYQDARENKQVLESFRTR